MARNHEKMNLMMNRWTSMKEEMAKGGPKERRPYLASECKHLPDAERWRREVIRDITRKVAEIQNAGMGEARIRDVNDEINKLLREKGHWERQIKALGGPDYFATAPRRGGATGDGGADGRELPGSGGYKYFGAAKDLPGVRELFAAAAAEVQVRRTRGEIFKTITPDYYGYRDEEDGALLPAEAAAERVLVAAAVAEWEAGAAGRRKRARTAAAVGEGGETGGKAAGEGAEEEEDDAADLAEQEEALKAAAFRTLVPLPSQAALEAALMAKKKELLLRRYGVSGGAGAASSLSLAGDAGGAGKPAG